MSDGIGKDKHPVYDLPWDERRLLAQALLDRSNRVADGRSALRAKYPPAVPDEMIDTANHHVYNDGPEAAIDYLADAELAIRNPDHKMSYGPVYHLLDHMYNWLQFQALLPEGKQELLDLVEELREHIDAKDWTAVADVAAELDAAVGGNRTSPGR